MRSISYIQSAGGCTKRESCDTPIVFIEPEVSPDALTLKSDDWGEIELPEEFVSMSGGMKAAYGNLYLIDNGWNTSTGITRVERASKTLKQISPLCVDASWQWIQFKGEWYGYGWDANKLLRLNADGESVTFIPWSRPYDSIYYEAVIFNDELYFCGEGMPLVKLNASRDGVTAIVGGGNYGHPVEFGGRLHFVTMEDISDPCIKRLDQSGTALEATTSWAGYGGTRDLRVVGGRLYAWVYWEYEGDSANYPVQYNEATGQFVGVGNDVQIQQLFAFNGKVYAANPLYGVYVQNASGGTFTKLSSIKVNTLFDIDGVLYGSASSGSNPGIYKGMDTTTPVSLYSTGYNWQLRKVQGRIFASGTGGVIRLNAAGTAFESIGITGTGWTHWAEAQGRDFISNQAEGLPVYELFATGSARSLGVSGPQYTIVHGNLLISEYTKSLSAPFRPINISSRYHPTGEVWAGKLARGYLLNMHGFKTLPSVSPAKFFQPGMPMHTQAGSYDPIQPIEDADLGVIWLLTYGDSDNTYSPTSIIFSK